MEPFNMTTPQYDELFLAIGRLEGKVDALISMQQYQQNQLIEHDKRLRILEHTRGYVMGWSVALGALASVCINIFVRLVN